MTKLYSTLVKVNGGRSGTAKSDDGKLDITLDTPESLGGKGGPGTNPEQLFAAGYAACFIGATQLVAGKQGIDVPADFNIDSHVTLSKSDAGDLDISVVFDIHLPGMDAKTAEKLIDDAHHVCPYSRATRGNIDIDFNIHI
ncbi:organic hydroperoxide resistance protein [Suttonella sp. R2A3]|uniref:organic hydroperoxide resistance protein n=1 Tax=Suttonella sp. R2A3 TaxID=2908648 RepID=UPI001F39CA54|nr:organic hydroperoxide resistance protein [Suttonella sp. R2A3]UJF24923.1 organic hydroperoxide resistance protein [Suttonella sp. R2A3]